MKSSSYETEYCINVLEPGNPGGWSKSLKTFDTGLEVSQGQQYDVDISICDAPGDAITGGAWVDFSCSTDVISYVSAGRYLWDGSEGLVGPWNATRDLINEPGGPGTIMTTVVGGLVGPVITPDGGNGIIIAKVTFNAIASGNATITVRTIPGVLT